VQLMCDLGVFSSQSQVCHTIERLDSGCIMVCYLLVIFTLSVL